VVARAGVCVAASEARREGRLARRASGAATQASERIASDMGERTNREQTRDGAWGAGEQTRDSAWCGGARPRCEIARVAEKKQDRD